MTATVKINREVDHVAEIVLDRPEALNAISTQHARAIADAAAQLTADSSIRVVVLTSSAERAFCVGADLKERNIFTDDELLSQRPVMQAAFGGIRDLPMPTIAAVHGYALGGGFELALSCDLIVADETAVFGLPEVSVGLVPGGGGTQLLGRRVGWSLARDLIFTGRRIRVGEAHVADRLVSAGHDRQAALDLASEIASNSPVGVRQAKLALRAGMDPLPAGLDAEDVAWRTTALSRDRREGIAAFNEKRTPDWPGE